MLACTLKRRKVFEAADKPRIASRMPEQGLASPCGVRGKAPLSPVGFDNTGLVNALKRLMALVPLFSLLVCAAAFAAPSAEEAGKALSALEQKTRGLTSLRADFEQTSHIPLFDKPVTSTGRLLFQKPGNLLWTTVSPYWEGFSFYNGSGRSWDERTGVTPMRPEREAASKAFLAGISGWVEFSVATAEKSYHVSVQSLAPLVLELTPKDRMLASVIASLVFTFSDDGVARTLTLNEASGGKTEIRFRNVAVNAPLSEADFTRPAR